MLSGCDPRGTDGRTSSCGLKTAVELAPIRIRNEKRACVRPSFGIRTLAGNLSCPMLGNIASMWTLPRIGHGPPARLRSTITHQAIDPPTRGSRRGRALTAIRRMAEEIKLRLSHHLASQTRLEVRSTSHPNTHARPLHDPLAVAFANERRITSACVMVSRTHLAMKDNDAFARTICSTRCS